MVLPAPVVATKLVVSLAGQALATQTEPPQPPQVHLVARSRARGSRQGKPVRFAWSVSGDAGQALTLGIDLSMDRSRWRMLEYGTTARRLTLPAGLLAAAPQVFA